MTFTPWQFTSPYIPYTKILAEQVNPNFNGISVSLKFVADELNQFIPRLPDGFAGNNKIPVGPYHNTLLGISQDGNMELVDRAAFTLLAGKDMTVVKTPDAAFTVDGNSHANFYYCQHEDADPEVVTAVTVNEAVATVEGSPAVATGSVMFFTQVNANPLVFVEAPGVTVITPGLLKAYGQGSTVALVAIDQFTWVLAGDIAPSEVVLPPTTTLEIVLSQGAAGHALTLYENGNEVQGVTVAWQWSFTSVIGAQLYEGADSGDSAHFEVDSGWSAPNGAVGTATVVYGSRTYTENIDQPPY